MNCHLAQGTVAGPYHVAQGIVNQDRGAYLAEDDFLILALADGAGSKPLSHLGAQLAVDTSVEVLRDRALVDQGLEQALTIAMECARDQVLSHNDYSLMGSTLVVAIVKGKEWCAGAVGDSFAVIQLADKSLLVTQDGESEYANITRLLTDRDFNPLIKSGLTNNLKSIILSSDGLSSLGICKGEPHMAFWTPLIQRVKDNSLDVDQFFGYLDSRDKIVDDTTLIIASCESS